MVFQNKKIEIVCVVVKKRFEAVTARGVQQTWCQYLTSKNSINRRRWFFVHQHLLCNYVTGCINHVSCEQALLETESSADTGAKTA